MHGDPQKGSCAKRGAGYATGLFDAECQKLGLDGAKTTLFEWLEADDRARYAK